MSPIENRRKCSKCNKYSLWTRHRARISILPWRRKRRSATHLWSPWVKVKGSLMIQVITRISPFWLAQMLCSRFLAENRTTGLVAFARTIRVSEPASSPQKVRTYTKFTGLILVELMKSHLILKLSASKMMRVPAVVTQSVAKMPWDFASSLKSSQVWLWSALRLTMMTSMKMRLDLGILSNDRTF